MKWIFSLCLPGVLPESFWPMRCPSPKSHPEQRSITLGPDNQVWARAGQAVQNMGIILGYDEKAERW